MVRPLIQTRSTAVTDEPDNGSSHWGPPRHSATYGPSVSPLTEASITRRR